MYLLLATVHIFYIFNAVLVHISHFVFGSCWYVLVLQNLTILELVCVICRV